MARFQNPFNIHFGTWCIYKHEPLARVFHRLKNKKVEQDSNLIHSVGLDSH